MELELGGSAHLPAAGVLGQDQRRARPGVWAAEVTAATQVGPGQGDTSGQITGKGF